MTTTRLADRRILLVDDDDDILRSMDIAVRSEGASTMLAHDGNEAIAMLDSFDPELLVLDMMLPRKSGLVVLEQIGEAEDPPAVIMVTANQGRRHMEYAQALGVSAYLVKPVAMQKLLDTIVSLLDRRGTSRRAES